MLNKTITLPAVSAILGLAALLPTQAFAQANDNLYIGQVITTAATYCPRGSVELNGGSLQVRDNAALYSVIGVTYGGDGRTTFGIPDMRGRSDIHYGTGQGLSAFEIGQSGGIETVTLQNFNMPSHSHKLADHAHEIPSHGHTANLATHTGAGNTNSPAGSSLATFPANNTPYAAGTPDGDNMANGVVTVDNSIAGTGTSKQRGLRTDTAGGNRLPVQTRSPYIVLRKCMITDGIFPPRQ